MIPKRAVVARYGPAPRGGAAAVPAALTRSLKAISPLATDAARVLGAHYLKKVPLDKPLRDVIAEMAEAFGLLGGSVDDAAAALESGVGGGAWGDVVRWAGTDSWLDRDRAEGAAQKAWGELAEALNTELNPPPPTAPDAFLPTGPRAINAKVDIAARIASMLGVRPGTQELLTEQLVRRLNREPRLGMPGRTATGQFVSGAPKSAKAAKTAKANTAAPRKLAPSTLKAIERRAQAYVAAKDEPAKAKAAAQLDKFVRDRDLFESEEMTEYVNALIDGVGPIGDDGQPMYGFGVRCKTCRREVAENGECACADVAGGRPVWRARRGGAAADGGPGPAADEPAKAMPRHPPRPPRQGPGINTDDIYRPMVMPPRGAPREAERRSLGFRRMASESDDEAEPAPPAERRPGMEPVFMRGLGAKKGGWGWGDAFDALSVVSPAVGIARLVGGKAAAARRRDPRPPLHGGFGWGDILDVASTVTPGLNTARMFL